VNIFEAHLLSPWEECALLLDTLIEEEGCLIASGGKAKLRLPLAMKSDLDKCLGRRISILRTDLDYRMLLLDCQNLEGR
jgi:hypothetical protein